MQDMLLEIQVLGDNLRFDIKSLLEHFQAPLVLPPSSGHMSGPNYLLSLIFLVPSNIVP